MPVLQTAGCNPASNCIGSFPEHVNEQLNLHALIEAVWLGADWTYEASFNDSLYPVPPVAFTFRQGLVGVPFRTQT